MHVYNLYIQFVYMYMYLRFDVVTHHEGKCRHQHFHAVACHLGTLLAININVVEVGSILRGEGDHRSVGHDSSKAARQLFPHCLKVHSCKKWFSIAIDKVFRQQNLGITVQHSRHNVVPKQPKIPGTNNQLHV